MPAEYDLVEAAVWVEEHGSSRLRKALQAGMLEKCRGAYRAERLEYERPGWGYLDIDNKTEKAVKYLLFEAVNPSEDALDAFLHARERWDDPNYPVQLQRWRVADGIVEEIITQKFLGRLAGIIAQKYLEVIEEGVLN